MCPKWRQNCQYQAVDFIILPPAGFQVRSRQWIGQGWGLRSRLLTGHFLRWLFMNQDLDWALGLDLVFDQVFNLIYFASDLIVLSSISLTSLDTKVAGIRD